MTGTGNPQWMLLDACCALSLYATNRMADILAALPVRCALAQRVQDEMLFVYRGGSGPDAKDKEPVNLHPFLATGLLTILSPSTSSENASYIAFATEVDDGEAMTLAIAVNRAMAVATDDKKARRVFIREAAHLPLFHAVELLHQWSVSQQITGLPLQEALVNGYERAGLRARRQDPLFGWWMLAKT